MPFTPSHAALALPFLRTPLVPSAVVIGTMGPDLPYFLPFDTFRNQTHSLWGVVTIDLAIGLVVWLVWAVALRAPLVDLSPAWVRERMPLPPVPPWRAGRRSVASFALLVLAVVVGTVTHLVWDAPSHPGWVTDHVAALRVELGGRHLYSLLQYANSIVGLVVVAVWVRRWVARAPRRPRESVAAPRIRSPLWVVGTCALIAAALLTWGSGVAGGASPADPALLFRVSRVGIGVGIAVVVLACAGWWTYRLRSTATTLPSTSA